MKLIWTLIAVFTVSIMTTTGISGQDGSSGPLRIAVAGVSHGHSAFILGRKGRNDLKIVGIYEPDSKLAKRLAGQYNLDYGIFYNDLNKMLEAVKPEAVAAFGSIYEHMSVVEACAPRHIHVMVEKPLATNMEHALKMEKLARENNILLLTDYETSWYPSTAKSFQLVNDSNFVGEIRKVVIHDGHQGPKEIGVNQEFFDWLTDPVQNGGGALFDFGCYGANLMTYLLKGEEPLSVTAVTSQYKPDIYPKVDDEATIIVSYPGAQCIIQASWNWPFGRKDMEIYGVSGYVIASNNQTMHLRNSKMNSESITKVTSNDIPVYEDPFTYFADAVRGKIKMTDYDPYSLKNNIVVVKILSAARESAKSGKTIFFAK